MCHLFNWDISNERTGIVKYTIPTGKNTFGIGVDLISGTVFATNYGDGTVSVIDQVKGVVTQTITVGGDPEGVAADPIRGTVYVADGNTNLVSVISTGHTTSCKELNNYPLLPLLCATSLYKSQPGQDRPSWPWVDALDFH